LKKLYQIIITLLLLALLSTILWFTLERIKSDSLTQIQDSLQTVTKTSHEALHIWIRHRKNDLKELAQEKAIIESTKALLSLHHNNQDIISSQALIGLRKIMMRKMATHHDIGFFIISPDFYNIASMRDSNINKQNIIFISRHSIINEVFVGNTLFIPPVESDVALLSPSGKLIDNLPTIFIASPIIDPSGEIIAVIAIRLELSRDFTNVTQLGRIGESGETYAFDNKGIMLSNSRFIDQLQHLGLVKSRESGMLSLRVADPGGNMLHGFKPKSLSDLPLTYMVQEALAGKVSTELKSYRDYRGVPVFGTWIWDESLGFGLTTEIDVDEALKPFYKMRFSIISIMLLVVIVSFSVLFMFFQFELKAKLRLKKLHDNLEVKVIERTKELEKLSTQDGLTGIANRRFFDQSLLAEWNRGLRNHQTLSLIIIDIDYFKRYNDHYGHQAGDECLKQVAKILTETTKRSGDVVARYGGEEFVLLLPNTTLKNAKDIANQCRNRILNANIDHAMTKVNNLTCVTISAGVSELMPSEGTQYSELVAIADKNLYQAKHLHRNNVQ
jgi:diguanylate cyclase (GGDEF)-like protein